MTDPQLRHSAIPQDAWEQRKEELLNRFRQKAPLTCEQIQAQKNEIQSQIDALEISNHSLNQSIKQRQLAFAQKKKENDRLMQEVDKRKKQMVRLQRLESSLINEVHFYQSEKDRLSHEHQNIQQGLQNNIMALDRSVKDIGFMRGETGVLIEKMSELEQEVPAEFSNKEQLDEIVFGTVKALQSLHQRMQTIEKTAKIKYYQKTSSH
ncbi:MAG: hypothetical protein HQK77_07985 [Desulfobacterales bacterium]|nr:hypothetical protein [Desulfobacterales bacterium]